MKNILQLSIIAILTLIQGMAFAGNPDRQGEAGAAELLFNPWARSAGVHSMNTSFASGVEAMRINVAGIGRITGRELQVGNARLYEGADLQMNSFGYAQRRGERGAFAFTLTSLNFGDIPVTTTDQPEGTGASFSPNFFNLGIGYSYTYENKISVGILLRAISESLPNLSAFGAAIDAGVQYVSGANDNFKLGISLRNVGTPMRFNGEGITLQGSVPDSDNPDYPIEFAVKPARYELPSMLNIGMSYDFYVINNEATDDSKGTVAYVRALANFTSNAFSRDQIGAGLEFNYNNMIALRGAYRYELGSLNSGTENLYTGFSGGASVFVPLSKSGATTLTIDYAYRTTDPFNGTHNFGIGLLF